MRCRGCGGRQEHRITDLPFKVTESSIVIIKALPVLQCRQCDDSELEDQIMERVEKLMAGIDTSADLEAVRFAA